MQKHFLIIAIFLICFLATAVPGISQKSRSLTAGIQRLFEKVEKDITSSAEAMPEDKYGFTPEKLNIPASKLEGVRTFAGQIMHLATDNILIWSAVTGDSVRADIADVNGPATIKSKADILAYLKASFEIGRRAMASVTDKNANDMMQFRWRKLTRLDLVFYGIVHSNEHYGQMALYLRMCGIIPPPTLLEQ